MLVGITDAGGNLIARYSYDEWGKLLRIEPAEEDNEEQLSIAQLNPLRYRGYYYDTESGLYYINSRYYSPELCRFISCGDYSSIDSSNKYGLNAYSYCYNSPAAFSNYDGTYKSSVDTAEIKQFLKNSIKVIKILNDEFTKALGIDKESIKKKANQILDKTKKFFDNMISRYNTFIDKLEYAINYPDAVINNVLSKIFNKDVNIRFRIIETLRANSNLNIDLSKFKFKMDGNGNQMMRSRSTSIREENNVAFAVFQGLFGGMILSEIFDAFRNINIDLGEIYRQSIKNDWADTFQEIMFTSISVFSAGSLAIKDYFQVFNIAEKGYKGIFEAFIKDDKNSGYVEEASKGTSFLRVFSLISSFVSFDDSMENAGNGSLSRNADVSLACVNLVFNIASVFFKGNPLLAIFSSLSFEIIPRVIAMRMEGIIIC